MAGRGGAGRLLVELDGAALAIFDGKIRGAGLAQRGHAEGLDVLVDGFKARQAPGVGRDQLALGALNAGEGGIEEKENVVNDWMIRNGCKAVIVRPDHYVFATCNDASSMNRALSDLMNQYNTNI